MSSIRPLELADLAQVVEIYERTMRSGRPGAPPGLEPYFERTLVDHPWVDPDIPSLVYEAEDGRILGFIGSHVRRLRFQGRAIRMGCAGHLISDPDQRHLAVGARLLRRYLSGPQELTITDGATQTVREMWVRLGGYELHPGSLSWTRLLRPSHAVGDGWLARKGYERSRRVARPVFAAFDAAAATVARPPVAVDVEIEELTAAALIEHQPEVSAEALLRVDYDEAFVEWLFRELPAVRTRGTLVRRLLRHRGRFLGWYVAYMKPGGVSQVMEIAATKGGISVVLDRLFQDAWRSGADALQGRIEPVLFEPLARRRCLLRYGARALFHSSDPEIAAAIGLGKSALTRLDGEWWMGHHTEAFD